MPSGGWMLAYVLMNMLLNIRENFLTLLLILVNKLQLTFGATWELGMLTFSAGKFVYK